MAQTKSEWRRMLLAARAAIPEGERRASSTALVARVRDLACFADARTILGYVAVGAEVDPASLCVASGSGPQGMLPGAGHSWWAERHPRDGSTAREVSIGDLELPLIVLVPGVGFDASGMRLGRGAGWYDRALAELRALGRVSVVGLAFECQVVTALPSDPWDQRVDVVVTERRVVTVAPTVVARRVAGYS
jgi:5-formyltetrahydrofolate cyclo-ligase